MESLNRINLKDLLMRDQIFVDNNQVKEISGKTILVTGGGGSIGRELCRQICGLNPKKLIILDNCEFNLYHIDHSLREFREKTIIQSIIGDIRDRKFLENLFTREKIEIVFHAAAYKHVPLMEFNVSEAVRNNIFGTLNLAQVSEKNSVKKFVLVSTDKAVNPANIMGCTKKIAEMVLQLFKKTEFVTVRFGNVLGSTGSVIPLFEEQIRNGGPVTITDPEIRRYFMTIPEAVQLIIQACAIGNKGEILILDMGKQYNITEVAEKLIRLHKLEPYKDIAIEYIGLRPGEKLFEELWSNKEKIKKTSHERIFTIDAEKINISKLKKDLRELKVFQNKFDEDLIKNKLKEMLPNYSEVLMCFSQN